MHLTSLISSASISPPYHARATVFREQRSLALKAFVPFPSLPFPFLPSYILPSLLFPSSPFLSLIPFSSFSFSFSFSSRPFPSLPFPFTPSPFLSYPIPSHPFPSPLLAPCLFIYLLAYLLPYSLTHLFTHSLTHFLPSSLPCLTHSLAPPLTRTTIEIARRSPYTKNRIKHAEGVGVGVGSCFGKDKPGRLRYQPPRPLYYSLRSLVFLALKFIL